MKYILKNPATNFAMLLMALAMAFTFLACDSEEKMLSEVTENGNVLSISDSAKIGKSAKYSFEAEIRVFNTITDASLLKSIYAPAEISTDDYSRNGLKKALWKLKKRHFSEKSEDDYPENGEPQYDKFEMNVHSGNDNFITIYYNHAGYWGGTHGAATATYKVFDLKNNKPVLLKDIMKNPEDETWNRILKANAIAQYKDESLNIEGELDNAIPMSDNFFFDDKGITFSYDQSYAFSTIEIYIPFDKKTENLLTPDFAKLASQNPNICEFPHRKILLKSVGQKKNFSLTLALCDDLDEYGYALYDGQTERMPIQLDREGLYIEIYRGKVNGQYAIAQDEIYYIRKKDNQRIELENISLDYEWQTYKTVKIGSQTWMAENLNYKTGTSWCYDNDESNCKKYGRLYTFETAKRVCPRGWHLPSSEEFSELAETVGGGAGRKLKTKSGWNRDGNGTDDYGFSALPAGERILNSEGKAMFLDAGFKSNWWSTPKLGGYDAGHCDIYDNYKSFGGCGSFRSNDYTGYSVRCVKD